MRQTMIAVLLLSLTGCEFPQDWTYVLGRIPQRDLYECERDANVAWGYFPQRKLFIKCMESLGYQRIQKN